jgi:tripartite-type tricarboxylate transporter receptor subunit TctC
MNRRFGSEACVVLVSVALTFLVVIPALPQNQPPIRIVYPFPAGGAGDAIIRLLAERIRSGLNRSVLVDNRSGGAGRIGVQAVKNALPDGSTLLFTVIAPMSIYQLVYAELGYDPVADFAPITQVGTYEFVAAVGPKTPVTSLNDFVAWAKVNPKDANYGVPAAGTLPHFLGVMFARASDLDMRAIVYRGGAPAITDLIGGQYPILFIGTTDVLEAYKADRIRILATSDRQRSPFLPDVPTFQESGYNLHGNGWYGLYAPAGTPSEFIDRVNQIVVAAIKTPEIRERLIVLGLTPTGTSAADLGAIQKADTELWRPAVRASGFTPEQ